jgi:hypothetical protein
VRRGIPIGIIAMQTYGQSEQAYGDNAQQRDRALPYHGARGVQFSL